MLAIFAKSMLQLIRAGRRVLLHGDSRIVAQILAIRDAAMLTVGIG